MYLIYRIYPERMSVRMGLVWPTCTFRAREVNIHGHSSIRIVVKYMKLLTMCCTYICMKSSILLKENKHDDL